MGLVPVIAAWGTQLVASTTAVAGADVRRVFGDLQRAGVDASGLAALAQGSLLSSVSLAATLASVLDRHFGAAALWSLLNAALAALGFIHAYKIDHAAVVADVGGLVFLRNSKALQAAVGYLLAAAILLWFSAGQEKRAKFPTSKAPISAIFHSFRLIFRRAIISWNGLEAWMLFPERARAEHSR